MTVFVILAGLMLAVALAFPLLPLLRVRGSVAPDPGARRHKALDDALAAGVIDQEEYASKRASLQPAAGPTTSTPGAGRSAFVATIAMVILLPAAAIVLYRLNGTPETLDPEKMAAAVAEAPAADGEHSVDMTKAIEGLIGKLKENPENADGWALLGRAYQATGQFVESRDAIKHAYDLSPGNNDTAVEYAQAFALANEGRRINGEPRRLIENVLKADPDHQRALWLIGISDFQQGHYDEAIAAWNRLLPNLPADSDIAQSVRVQIAEAQKLGGTVAAGPSATPAAISAPAVAAASPVATNGPRLTVHVTLDDTLKPRLEAGDTLFVFARAAAGPPMPLAIQRVPANGLPLTVTLDDSMGMMPSMKLSMFPQVIIGARISKSGNAIAQSGDLQVLTQPIDVSRTQPLDLVIDSVVP